ncbi:MAG: adenosine deaminase [Bryobacteraceae bacterium]|nr:adenosine deaminase [Bryobacteraceae bacterium]
MVEFHRQLAKAELHLHLEGSLEPETLCELDPSLTPEAVLARYRRSGFPAFIEAYKWVMSYLRGPEPYALAARRLFENLARENVRYAEINLSAGAILYLGFDFDAIFNAVSSETCAAIQVRFIFDAVRQFGPQAALEVARLAASRAGQGVVAFGVGGDERSAPLESFLPAFDCARAAGLKIVPHAGETMGPEAVWSALRIGAHRIGHGFRAAEDRALLRALRDAAIPLEICLSSNVATGAVPRLAAHPIRRIYDAGVPIVLNTDDPAMFGASLSREYELAETLFGFTRPELEALAAASFNYAFDFTPGAAHAHSPAADKRR